MMLFPFHARKDGGAVYVHEAGTMTLNDFATFPENVARNVGALYLACISLAC